MSTIESSKEVTLTWKGLTAYAKDKAILNNCEGYCQPGEMLAIMGPSGAGKTTLLSLLSQRNNPSLNIQGSILANGQPFTQKSFYSFGTFVYQNDLLLSTLTVRETLEFAANLKLESNREAQQEVNKLLEEFEMQKIEHTYVGSQAVKGISGGEKKRVCIAVEMVSKPSLIILDQPTSGLDSNKAAKVLSILKKLTVHRHTVIFTLHQPSYLQYAKLDRLILLNRGQTVYQGPAQAIGPYMESVGISVSNKMTISDFFMLQISDYKKDNDGYDTPLNYQNYSSKQSSVIQEKVDELNATKNSLAQFKDIYMASFIVAFWLLLKREWWTYWRDKSKAGILVINILAIFCFVGLLFKDAIPSRSTINSDPIGIFFTIQSVAFICTAAVAVTALNSISLTIPLERQLYMKETDSKKYTTFPYYITKFLIFFFGNLICFVIFCLSSYWLNGWTQDFDHWINFTLITLMLNATGCSIGLFCAALFKHISKVSALTNILIIPMMTLAGLYKKLDQLAVWIDWLQYLSPFRYGFQLFMQNEFRDEKFGVNGFYDYAKDLGYTLNYSQNFLVLLALTFAFFYGGFLLLKFNTDKVVA